MTLFNMFFYTGALLQRTVSGKRWGKKCSLYFLKNVAMNVNSNGNHGLFPNIISYATVTLTFRESCSSMIESKLGREEEEEEVEEGEEEEEE